MVGTEASTADWLSAVAGIGAAVAALVLTALAYAQMRASRAQSLAARKQVELSASAIERSTMPLVYAHAHGPLSWSTEDDAFVVPYFLSNEGFGPALNVEHGVYIDGTEYPFGADEPFLFRTIQPREFLPPLDPEGSPNIPPVAIRREIQRDELYAGKLGPSEPVGEIIYYCRYENMFGDRWETRNSSDPAKSPDIRPLGTVADDNDIWCETERPRSDPGTTGSSGQHRSDSVPS